MIRDNRLCELPFSRISTNSARRRGATPIELADSLTRLGDERWSTPPTRAAKACFARRFPAVPVMASPVARMSWICATRITD